MDELLELVVASVLLVVVHQSIYSFILCLTVVCLAGRHRFTVYLRVNLLLLLLLLEALLGKLLDASLIVETAFRPYACRSHAERLQS